MEKMIINLQDVNLTDTSMFEEYSDDKEQLKVELDNIPFTHTYLPPEIKARDEAIMASLKKMNPNTLKSKGDDLIKAQGLNEKTNDLIEHMASKSNGNLAHFNSLWSPVVWQARETNSQANITVGNQTMKVFDLDYVIAESLQYLYAEADPQAEYYDWIERQRKIEVDLNTDGASEEEIATRNSFISFLDDRETELKRVIFLYSGSAFNPNCRQQTAAQEKLKFLTFKLSELRRLRERTANTKSKADDKEYKEKQEQSRERQAAVIKESMSLVSKTADLLSLGNKRIYNNMNSGYFEHGIGETFVNLRPDTLTPEQALAKINSARQNNRQMAEMFAAMRRGMSKEEWLKSQEKDNRPIAQSVRDKIRTLRGWSVQRFNEYTEK